MRRTLLLLLGLILVCGVMLFGRHYLDAHPVLVGIITTVIVAGAWVLW